MIILRPIILFLLYSTCCYAQTLIPGETYYDETGFVEYKAGNLPIIISAPHGGEWRPDSIPDRDCTGCVFSMDAFTQGITRDLVDRLSELLGCFPHMVVNKLHRIKFDANRDIGDAADGNALVEKAWQGYHDFINISKDKIVDQYGKGLFLDMHGHAHTIQRIELGYLLSRAELQMTDNDLNNVALSLESSITALAADNVNDLSLAELLRGNRSLGELIDERGFSTVPSQRIPYPADNEAYFTGGYNTARHGSRGAEGTIDAIQIELNQDVRFDEERREVLVEKMAESILLYLGLNYFEDFGLEPCDGSTNVIDVESDNLRINLFPNPADDHIHVQGILDKATVQIYNLLGQLVHHQTISQDEQMYISQLNSGQYIIKVVLNDQKIISRKFLVR